MKLISSTQRRFVQSSFYQEIKENLKKKINLNVKVKWLEAKTNCESTNMQLVAIESQEENDDILKIIHDKGILDISEIFLHIQNTYAKLMC